MGTPQSCPECARVFRWGADVDSAIVDAGGNNWRSCRENAHWKLSFHMRAEHPTAGFACPRRGESAAIREGQDWWGTEDGHKSCSYCGSLSPEAFFAAIDAGVKIGPTDKSYKVYVDLPHPDAGKPAVLSSANFKPPGEGWTEITDQSRETLPLDDYQRANYKNGTWVRVSPRGPSAHAKFYFQHLSDAQRDRFIELLNEKKVNLGYPGYFYVLPFFAKPAEPTNDNKASH